MAIAPLSFRWDGDFVERVDLARGLATRTDFVQQCVESVLEGGDQSVSEILRRVGKRQVAKSRELSVAGAHRRVTEKHKEKKK